MRPLLGVLQGLSTAKKNENSSGIFLSLNSLSRGGKKSKTGRDLLEFV
jgi:hypothetical protein